MAQFYSLEEAARILGMSPDELKSKAQHREVRAFLDGGSWRFRVVDVDELARRRGLGSDAEPQLSDLDVQSASGGESLDHLDLSEFQLGVARPDLGNETTDLRAFSPKSKGQPAPDSGSEHDILFDDLSVPPSPVAGASSVIISMQSGGTVPTDPDVRLVPEYVLGGSDSDVRLVPDLGKEASGSDVRLATPDPESSLALSDVSSMWAGDSDVTLVKDDSADHGLVGPSAGVEDTTIGSSPVLDSSAEIPVAQPDSQSDFELIPSGDLVDALQPEAGSDFELSALEGSDEYESTPRRPGDSDVTAADPNLSGINLSRPSDSGINLQTATEGAFELEHPDSIELAPLSDDEIRSFHPSEASAPGQTATPDSSLAGTPPPALKKGEKDIFDDTDYEVDVPLSDEDSSGDKTVSLEAASDFELDESDNVSEVFAIDEEEVDQNAATAMSPSALAEDEDEDDGFEEAVSSEMATAWSSGEGQASTAGAPAVVISRETVPEWGSVWVGVLSFATVFLLFAAFIVLDLMRNLYDFRETPLASGLVRTIAGIFGG
jgi:hypothetical protein